jgi:hypothetical protein
LNMDIKAAIAVINQMQADGVVGLQFLNDTP